jgi:hypothetical protein
MLTVFDTLLVPSRSRRRNTATRSPTILGETLKIDRRIIVGAHLLAAALLFAACADKGTVAPSSSPPLDLSKAKSFDATVVSTIEAINPEGGISTKRELSQKVKAKLRAGGNFRGNILPINGDPSGDYEPAVTPVVALATDELWSDFDETIVDSASGRTIRIVARGPGNGSPIDNVWVWVDGVPGVRMSSVWRPAVGGWTLYRQTITGFGGGFEPIMRVTSTVNSSTTLYTGNASFGSQVAALPGKALDQIACWLTPESAQAMTLTACWYQAGLFTAETFGMGVGTAFLFSALPAAAPVSPWVITAYVSGWGLWTDSLYSLLDCLQKMPTRKTKRPNKTEVTNEFGF